jgi:SM-20-related protein
MAVLDIDVIRNAELKRDPFEHFIGADFVRKDAVAGLQASFPDFRTPGFHPVPDEMMKGEFGEAIRELKGDPMSAALSEKFGVDFLQFPRFVTVRKISAAHEGRIHCDSESKVMSLLLYLNEGWSSPDGRLRVLRSQNSFDDYAAEVDPKVGSVFAFMRRDHSWHGHTPFVGERRVIQVAWLRSQDEIDRKSKRHKVSGFLKGIFGKKPEPAM